MQKHTSNLIKVTAVAGLLAPASGAFAATDYVLDDASQWANTKANEVPAMEDAAEHTSGSGSWVSNPTAAASDDQHFIYVQGGTDSQDPDTANGSNGTNPQLLFDASTVNDGADTQVEVGQIDRVAWNTNRKSGTSGSGPHWFFQVFTRDDTAVTFALTDSTNYSNDKWNSLEADKSDTGDSIGDDDGPTGDNATELEVAVYDERRSNNSTGMYPQKTFAEWADEKTKPDWWTEEIKFAAFATGSNYKGLDSNLDNLQFDYDTGSASDQVRLDLEAIPEPAAVMAGLVSFGVLGLRRRRGAIDGNA